MNGPRQIAFAAVTAAIHQATDAAEGVSERDARREGVGDFPKRQFFETDVQDAGERRADESAVKDESAVANVEHLPKRFAGEVFTPVGYHVKAARADEGAQDQPGAKINDGLARDAGAQRPPAGGPESGEETERNQDAVPVDSEIAELKGNFIHAAGKLGSAL